MCRVPPLVALLTSKGSGVCKRDRFKLLMIWASWCRRRALTDWESVWGLPILILSIWPLAVAIELGIFLVTSLGVNLVYWIGPVMKRFRTAFMNVVGAGNPSDAWTNCTNSLSVCLVPWSFPANAEDTTGTGTISGSVVYCWIWTFHAFWLDFFDPDKIGSGLVL